MVTMKRHVFALLTMSALGLVMTSACATIQQPTNPSTDGKACSCIGGNVELTDCDVGTGVRVGEWCCTTEKVTDPDSINFGMPVQCINCHYYECKTDVASQPNPHINHFLAVVATTVDVYLDEGSDPTPGTIIQIRPGSYLVELNNRSYNRSQKWVSAANVTAARCGAR
jgi:hypothetical protein